MGRQTPIRDQEDVLPKDGGTKEDGDHDDVLPKDGETEDGKAISPLVSTDKKMGRQEPQCR